MHVLAPLALLWLAAIPVLIWLWRLAATAHRTVVPSLVPFEHLLRKSAARRRRLIVNWLFWLQLATLALAALALAQPALLTRRARTILVVLDTSASMQAADGRGTRWDRARQQALTVVARKRPADRVFVVTTAPLNPLTPQPLSDAAELRRVIDGASPADLAGNLAITTRVGRALLGDEPDAVVVVTDEPAPERRDRIEFRTIGGPQPNVAIAGIESREALCTPAPPQLVVSVLNAAPAEQTVRVTLGQDGRTFSTMTKTLGAGAREPVALDLSTMKIANPSRKPPGAWLTVSVDAPQNALTVDDQVQVLVHGQERIPVVVASSSPELMHAIGRWLDACPTILTTPVKLDEANGSGEALVRTVQEQAREAAEAVLVTDRMELARAWPRGAVAFAPPGPGERLRSAQWLIDTPHEIADYLTSLDVVATAASPEQADVAWGEPIVSAVVDGRRVPLVRATGAHGRRMVAMRFNPAVAGSSTAPVVLFFNSLRWLTGASQVVRTGEPLTVGPFARGAVRVRGPDGGSRDVAHDGGLLRFQATDHVGRYRFAQGKTVIERVVNFLDPVESQTHAPVSSWASEAEDARAPAPAKPAQRPLARPALMVALAALLIEWIWAALRVRRVPAPSVGASRARVG